MGDRAAHQSDAFPAAPATDRMKDAAEGSSFPFRASCDVKSDWI